MTLFLRRSEVEGLLDLPQAMRVLEQTFREQAAGAVKQVAPLRFMQRGMRMVVGGLEAQNKNGLRVSVTGGEALALLFEISSGNLQCLMGYPFSNVRISATVGLAIERFTDSKVKTAALIGSGRLALPLLQPAFAVAARTRICLQPRCEKSREVCARSERATACRRSARGVRTGSDRTRRFRSGEHQLACRGAPG